MPNERRPSNWDRLDRVIRRAIATTRDLASLAFYLHALYRMATS